jgi:hypothetical protein
MHYLSSRKEFVMIPLQTRKIGLIAMMSSQEGRQRFIGIHRASGRIQTREQSNSAWITIRRGTISIGEQNASARQGIDIGRVNTHAGMKATYPRVKIINNDQQDIGPMRILTREE